MREHELEILEQYDIEVTGTRKVRGAYFCDTNEGTMLLKETKMSDRRAPFFYEMLSNLQSNGCPNVELPVKNKEGNFVSASENGNRYMLKKWFVGKECDVHRENEILRAAEELAILHTKMQWTGSLCEGAVIAGRHLKEEFLCHNRELKKVRAFIRSRPQKGKFEYLYLQYFEKMYQQALRVMTRLEDSGYEKLYRESMEEKRFIHGDYNYHNVLILPERQNVFARTEAGRNAAVQLAVTGFEHFCMDVQMQDFYYFYRKVLEKYRWDERIGTAMLEAYQFVRPLQKEELEFVALRLAYPEKFWKVASTYYRSNKAWTPEKNLEKLSLAIVESEEKMKFIKNIFQLVL